MSKILMHVVFILFILLNVSCGDANSTPESVKVGDIQKFGEKFLNKNVQYFGYIKSIYPCNHNNGYTCIDISDGANRDVILIKTDKVDVNLFNESLEKKVSLIFIGSVKKMSAAKGLSGDTVSSPAFVANLIKKEEAAAPNSTVVGSNNANSLIKSERSSHGWQDIDGAKYSYDRTNLKKISGVISFSIGYNLVSPFAIPGRELFGNSVIKDYSLQCEKSVLKGIENTFSGRYFQGVVLEQIELSAIDFSKQSFQLGLEPFTLEGMGRQVEGAIKDELDSDLKFLQPILAIVVPLCRG